MIFVCVQSLPIPPPGFEDDVPADNVTLTPGKVSEPGFQFGEGVEIRSQETTKDDLSILLPPPAGFPVGDIEEPEMETFDVTLVKDHQGLGITIAGYVCEKGESVLILCELLFLLCCPLHP